MSRETVNIGSIKTFVHSGTPEPGERNKEMQKAYAEVARKRELLKARRRKYTLVAAALIMMAAVILLVLKSG
jgi:hypothetical protein